MSDHTLIQGGRVVAADGEYDADVLIAGESIAAVGAVSAPEGATVIDASGCLLLPGLIDNHTHMAMPFMGMRSSDDYDTGTRAAAAGGVTCIVDFSIQREPDGLASALEEWKGRADGAAHVDYGFHMAITNANASTIEDMGAMVEAGVSSFKLFMAYKGELMVRDDELAATMERARDLGALVMVHAENGDIVDLLVRRALATGDTSAIHHALTRPEMVEAEATSRAARLAEHTGASLFVVHVTCAAAAAEVEAAQQRGAHVSGETCVQYLVNTIDDLRRPGVEGCRYICSPPLRDGSNHEPLWDYVRRGVLESVSTDHCPFDDEQKARGLHDFSLVPNGLPAIQHRLAKLWDEGVLAGRITPSQLVDRTSTTVARRFGLDAKGAIAPGKDADIVVLRPERAEALWRGDVVHERRLRPLRGRDRERQRAPHAVPRHDGLRPRRDPHRARPRPLRGTVRGALGGARMTLQIDVDVDAVLADLRELHERFGGPDGARRLAWSPDWLAARGVVPREARRPAGHRRGGPGREHLGHAARGRLDGRLRHRRLAHRRRALRRLAGRRAGPPGRARGAARARRRPARPRRSRSASSTGPTRRERASAAACWAPPPPRGRSMPTTSATSATARAPAWGTRLRPAASTSTRRRARPRSLLGALAYVELHIEQGPVLLDCGRLASAVSGTFGDERYLVTFKGQAAHAGSTPMRLRRDALAAAATAALEIREVGIRHDGVCTVGAMKADPGVITAVAGSTAR